ncbi:ImuA family protein [Roseibium aquae]|uniref:ImuA family protein n=1 Tax=Roseibium aquae TaxID=1323746 RepID=UPI00123CDEA6|nr:hypothetical protein [Roseibium aquae]
MPELDRLFADGSLRLASLHEVVGMQSRDSGAVSGFVMALLKRIANLRPGPVLWVAAPDATREAGVVHGPGLVRFGLDAQRVMAVFPHRLEEALWVLEEGASCPALAAVWGDIQGRHRALDLTATRRLLLRAQASGVPVLLARHGTVDEPTAALTRFCIAPKPSLPPGLLAHGPHDGLGRAGWQVDVTRNRDGRPGQADVEWDHATGQFVAPARSIALVSRPAGGPDPAAAERRRPAHAWPQGTGR